MKPSHAAVDEFNHIIQAGCSLAQAGEGSTLLILQYGLDGLGNSGIECDIESLLMQIFQKNTLGNLIRSCIKVAGC